LAIVSVVTAEGLCILEHIRLTHASGVIVVVCT
jgi:hypothetical protein